MIKILSIAWQYLDSFFTIIKTIINYILRGHTPPKPKNLKIYHGIYWAPMQQDSSEIVPYCPTCTAKSLYTPLQRVTRRANGSPRKDGLFGYRCQSCGFYTQLSEEEENEVRNHFNI